MDNNKPFSVLLVEDDQVLQRAISRLLKDWSTELLTASTLWEAKEKIKPPPNLIILDIGLPDGSGVQLAEELNKITPMPLCIVMSGQATAEEAFRLKELGVVGYLQKPVSLEDFTATVAAILETPPSIEPLLKAQVGRTPFQKVQKNVRKTMLEQAISMTDGNKTHAAKLLNVSRQAIQQMIQEFELETKPTQ